MPENEANQLHQDDTPTVQAEPQTNHASSSSVSDSDDEDESEKPTYTSASTQYEANPEGSVIIGRSKEGIQAVWKAAAAPVVSVASSSVPSLPAPAPAFAISNLVHSPNASRSTAAGPSSASDPASYQTSFSTLRVSGATSSSLTPGAPNSWNLRRERTPPPLGTLFANNAILGGGSGSSPALSATSKLSLPPLSRPQSHFGLGGEPPAILTGSSSHQRSSGMDLDP